MLILKRRQGQGFMISDDVQVIILSNKDGEIEVGVSAPRSVPVLRMELLRQSDSHARFNNH
jgi:carbon storage regulator